MAEEDRKNVFVMPGTYFQVGPVEYDQRWCMGAMQAIVSLLGAMYLDNAHRDDPGTRRLMEYDANELRKLIAVYACRPLPPLRFVWDGAVVGLAWVRE